MSNTDASAPASSPRRRAVTLAIGILLAASAAGGWYVWQAVQQAAAPSSIEPATPAASAVTLPAPSAEPPDGRTAFADLFGVTPDGATAKTGTHELTHFLLGHEFRVGDEDYAVAVFYTQQLNDAGEPEDARAQPVTLATITYKRAGAGWAIVARQTEVGTSGSGGALQTDIPEFLQLSPESYAMLFTEHSMMGGHRASGYSVLAFVDERWQHAGYVETSADNEGACREDFEPAMREADESTSPCFAYEGKLTLAPGPDARLPDLVIQRTGTQLATPPDRVEPATPLVYQFFEGAYTEAAYATDSD